MSCRRDTILPRYLTQINVFERKVTMLIAVYPGSFDPITNGHLDIIHVLPACLIASLWQWVDRLLRNRCFLSQNGWRY